MLHWQGSLNIFAHACSLFCLQAIWALCHCKHPPPIDLTTSWESLLHTQIQRFCLRNIVKEILFPYNMTGNEKVSNQSPPPNPQNYLETSTANKHSLLMPPNNLNSKDKQNQPQRVRYVCEILFGSFRDISSVFYDHIRDYFESCPCVFFSIVGPERKFTFRFTTNGYPHIWFQCWLARTCIPACMVVQRAQESCQTQNHWHGQNVQGKECGLHFEIYHGTLNQEINVYKQNGQHTGTSESRHKNRSAPKWALSNYESAYAMIHCAHGQCIIATIKCI